MRQMDTRSGSQCSVTPAAILNNEQLVLPPRISRVNGWSLPLHYFQVVTWAVFVGLSSATFGIFIPLLPHVWKYIAYVSLPQWRSGDTVSRIGGFLVSPTSRMKLQTLTVRRQAVIGPWPRQSTSTFSNSRRMCLRGFLIQNPAKVLGMLRRSLLVCLEAKKMTTFGYLIKTCKEESSKHQAVRKDPYMQMEEGFLQQGDGALGSSAQGVKAKSSLLIYKCPCHFCTSVNPDRGSTAREADDAPSTSTLGLQQETTEPMKTDSAERKTEIQELRCPCDPGLPP
ncbi:probable palmitoyltransferase ZDHHC11B isoform X2 [Pongo abelii]|uniref:probable palmitoyltransferase ZDHHC11B isoform X2 n=1 Tax=Pongo abelii TaxID=9601 RepID=UPI0023E82379|nr:probable palmitoyltransferase ZDHHC11B isoform X2 [Pongo abelii]